jgi:hypothetical protein
MCSTLVDQHIKISVNKNCYRVRYRQNVPHLLWARHECARAGRGRPSQNGLVLPSERLPCCWRRDARSKDCPRDVRAQGASGGPEVCAERESVQKLSSSERVPLDRSGGLRTNDLAGWLRVTAAATSIPGGVERSLTQKPWRSGNAFVLINALDESGDREMFLERDDTHHCSFQVCFPTIGCLHQRHHTPSSGVRSPQGNTRQHICNVSSGSWLCENVLAAH